MKAEELMIDDWVMIGDRLCKASVIHGYYIEVDIYSRGLFDDKDVKPVRITPDILERNDFIKFNFPNIEGLHVWTLHLFPSCLVSLTPRELNDNTDNGWMIVVTMPPTELQLKIYYVHELQHALRLCEIDKEIKL